MNRWPHVVTIQTPDESDLATDPYGNRLIDWSQVEAVETRGFFQPGPGSEDTNMRDFQIGDGALYVAPSTVITGASRVGVQGAVYDVQGPPEVVVIGSPLDHKRASLRYVSG